MFPTQLEQGDHVPTHRVESRHLPTLTRASAWKPYHSPMNVFARRLGRAMHTIKSPLSSVGYARPQTAHGLLTTNKDSTLDRPKLKDTAYLDGLRGLAALLVYWFHYEQWTHPGSLTLETTYGRHDQWKIVCLPFIRILFSGGHTAVMVFFVISGYVLSSAPLKLIHSRDTASLHEHLSSALFRRWTRLYLPVLAVSWIYIATWWVLGFRSDLRAPTSFFGEMVRWFYDFTRISFPFDKDWRIYDYHPHCWSIAIEFRGSLVVYLAMLALSQVAVTSRLAILGGLIYYLLSAVEGWYAALFLGGTSLCELEMILQEWEVKNQHKTRWIFRVAFIFALYLAGYPSLENSRSDLRASLGWWTLASLSPISDVRHWWGFWSAILLVASIPRVAAAKRFFETDFIQYLGRVSFCLYLFHGPIFWTIGDRLFVMVGRYSAGTHTPVPAWWADLIPHLPDAGLYGLELNVVAPHVILLPLTLKVASLATRYIDEPAVKVARWTFNRARRTGASS